MKYQSIVLALLSIHLSQTCIASPITLAWDGSPSADVAGYRIYTQIPDQPTTSKDVGNVLTATLDIPIATPVLFYATAYSSNGLESGPSNTCAYWEALGTSLSIVAAQGGGLKLMWLQGPDFTKAYQVVQGIGSDAQITWNKTNTVTGYTNSSANVQLVQGTNYFRVRPVFQGLPGFPDYTSGYSETEQVAPPGRPSLRLVLPQGQIVHPNPRDLGQ